MTSRAHRDGGQGRTFAAAVDQTPDDAPHRRALLALLPDAAFTLDAAGRVAEANAAAETLCGAPEASLVGRPLLDFIAHRDLEESRRRFEAARHGAPQRWDVHFGSARGEQIHAELGLAAASDGADAVGFAALVHDVSRQRELEADLTRRALHDPLTGLANRVLFRDRVERALTRFLRATELLRDPTRATPAEDAARPTLVGPGGPTTGHHIAVLFVDLDDFKTVNDSLGHAEGDRLLEEVSARLLKATRGFDLVARLGGDEFGILLDGMMRETDAEAVIQRVSSALNRPIVLQAREVVLGASIGVAYARDARNVDELLRNADVAMYQAKAAGKSRYAEFDPAMHAAALARLEMAADLRYAVERQQLALVYQPLVDLATGTVQGVEALLRWHRPGHDVVSPLTFVPLAEETGLIVPIGLWVLREACEQLGRWRAEVAVPLALTLNVNVSGRQLTEPGFVRAVQEILAETNVRPGDVTLEVTESVFVQRGDDVVGVLVALREHGLRLAIDDFGTGYSSLGYLRDLPVDILKIDRSFVDSVDRGGSEAALARTIVALGDALGLEAIAEGIEQSGQHAALAALGCRRGQGYFFARPMHPADFGRHLARAGDQRLPLVDEPGA